MMKMDDILPDLYLRLVFLAANEHNLAELV